MWRFSTGYSLKLTPSNLNPTPPTVSLPYLYRTPTLFSLRMLKSLANTSSIISTTSSPIFWRNDNLLTTHSNRACPLLFWSIFGILLRSLFFYFILCGCHELGMIFLSIFYFLLCLVVILVFIALFFFIMLKGKKWHKHYIQEVSASNGEPADYTHREVNWCLKEGSASKGDQAYYT